MCTMAIRLAFQRQNTRMVLFSFDRNQQSAWLVTRSLDTYVPEDFKHMYVPRSSIVIIARHVSKNLTSTVLLLLLLLWEWQSGQDTHIFRVHWSWSICQCCLCMFATV